MKNIKLFLKRNAIYLVVAFCILAIGLTITLVAVSKGNKVKLETANVESTDYSVIDETENIVPINEENKTVEPVSEDETIIFTMPVSSFSRTVDYTDSLYYNSTLKRYQSHKAIDFYAEEGTPVYAVYDGTVCSVENGLLEGYTITIDHGNGLKTIYNSLLDGDMVSVGDVVKKGDIIGEVSSSNRQEYKEGAHLHFAVTKDGVLVNPGEYLITDNK